MHFCIVIILVILYIVWHNMYLWCWWHLWNILLLFTHAWCHGSHAMSIILIFISTTIACLACCQKDLYVCCSFFLKKQMFIDGVCMHINRTCLEQQHCASLWFWIYLLPRNMWYWMNVDMAITNFWKSHLNQYPINFTLHDNLNKWCNRTWNTIFGFYCEKTFQLKRCHCLIYLLLKGYHSTLVISDSIILFKCPSLECIEATSNCVRLQCKLFVYARIRKII